MNSKQTTLSAESRTLNCICVLWPQKYLCGGALATISLEFCGSVGAAKYGDDRNRQAFPETDAAWARPGHKIEMNGYRLFPSVNSTWVEENPRVRDKAGRGAAALQV
ncbi:MAG: hypothetical protein WC959_01890 [Kiritimatiellales bacterium]